MGSYRYDAWGNTISTTGYQDIVQLNPFRYRGYYYDTETGLYYLNSRYYDPALRRFISADHVAFLGGSGSLSGYNLFSYCENNPVMYKDPSGYLAYPGQIHQLVLEHIVGLYSNLSINNTCIYYNKENFWGGWGFCDIYDTITFEVWELKRITCSKEKALKQLNRYLDGALSKNLKQSLFRGGDSIKDGEFVTTIGSVRYFIKYWNDGDGILYYDYTYEVNYEELAMKIAGILIFAGSIALIPATGGLSAIGTVGVFA